MTRREMYNEKVHYTVSYQQKNGKWYKLAKFDEDEKDEAIEYYQDLLDKREPLPKRPGLGLNTPLRVGRWTKGSSITQFWGERRKYQANGKVTLEPHLYSPWSGRDLRAFKLIAGPKTVNQHQETRIYA